jgi:hypothetical protein
MDGGGVGDSFSLHLNLNFAPLKMMRVDGVCDIINFHMLIIIRA